MCSSKGYPRYCEAQSLADGTTILTGGRSRRGKLRGPPGSRDLQVTKIYMTFVYACNYVAQKVLSASIQSFYKIL